MIVGESTIEAALDKADLKAEKHIAKELRRELEGHRSGSAGSRQRSQLTRSGITPPGWSARRARSPAIAGCWHRDDAQGFERNGQVKKAFQSRRRARSSNSI